MSSTGEQSKRELTALDATGVSSRAIETLIARALADPTAVASVIVPPPFAKRCVEALRGGGIRVSSVVAYPLGLAKATVKAIEATSLAKDGVDAIEVTPYPSHLIDGDADALRTELLEIVRGARAAKPAVAVHVWIDLDQLGDVDLESIARTVLRSAADGVVLQSRSAVRLTDGAATVRSTGCSVRIRST